MRLKRSAMTGLAVSLMWGVTLIGGTGVSAAGTPLVPATSNANWSTITSLPGSLMGLAGDSAGNLLTFDASPQLNLIQANALTGAEHGVPIIPGALEHMTPSSYVNATGGEWIAGVVPLSNGTTLFDSGYANEIDLSTAPGVYSVAFSNSWLANPTGMAMDPSGTALYVVNSDPTVTGGSSVYRVPVSGSNFNWAGATKVIGGLNYAMGAVVSPSGTLYVADLTDRTIVAATAGQIQNAVSTATPLTPTSGLTTITGSVAELLGVNGLAMDASGNLFFSEYIGYPIGQGHLAVGEIPASWLAGSTPATLENGGIIDLADTNTLTSIDSGLQPLTIVHGVLLAGSYATNKIYAYPLNGLPRLANLTASVSGGNLTAVWGYSGAAYYTCTLMVGLLTPTSFTSTTRGTSCTFYGVSSAGYGVRVVAYDASGLASVAQTVFPTPYTITCVKGTSVRQVTGIAPTCPTGWRQK